MQDVATPYRTKEVFEILFKVFCNCVIGLDTLSSAMAEWNGLPIDRTSIRWDIFLFFLVIFKVSATKTLQKQQMN